MEAKIE